MPRGRPKKPLAMTAEERATLEAWARRPKSSQRLALRSKIVLACDEGLANQAVAEKLGVAANTVTKWRERFRVDRLEGLADEPRPGPPRTVTDEQVYEVITRTLETTPPNATHWTTRSLAKELGLTQNAVWRIWNAFALQPHRQKTFKLSTDPLFVEKVRDIVGLYLNPPDRAVVLCVDEKSQVQALDRSQPLLPIRPGSPERRSHDYTRHGTTSLFAALDIRTGEVMGRCHRRHRHQEFLRFLKRLDQVVKDKHPEGTVVHLVMDNYATHKTPGVKRWFARHPEYRIHFTPTSASWLNQVERFFAEITSKRIRRGVFRSVRALEQAIYDYLQEHNEEPQPFTWTADADLILQRTANVARTCQSGH